MKRPTLSTDRRVMPDRRMTKDHVREGLLALGFNHIVIIAKDCSVRSVGAIDGAFFNGYDARKMAEHLNFINSVEDGWIVEPLA